MDMLIAIMKYRVIIQVASFLLCLLSGVGLVSAQGTVDYTLGAGDKIRIQVFGEDDLTVESLVADSGNISYPFLGEIQVKGKTVEGLERFITKELKGPYLIKPEVTVSILEYRQFFVNGRVNQPGGFAFQPGMTVRKAVSLAGGFEERANKEKIFIVRGDDANAKPSPVRLDDRVQPGDIITVERSFF